MKVAVTGGSGFVGSALIRHLRNKSADVVELSRSDLGNPLPKMAGSDVLIHCAGIAHRSGRDTPSPEEYDEVNHKVAVRLAEAAREAGVGRFVFVSSINVVAGNKHSTLSPDSPYAPISPYGHSKARAEKSLLGIDGIETVVVRSPVVCGPGAPGNMRLLMRLCDSAIPLPFGAAGNARTLIGVTNLTSALYHLATAPSKDVVRKIFHAADGATSTRELVEEARRALGRPVRNVLAPPAIVRATLSVLGKGKMADQLFGDLIVSSYSLRAIGWAPEVSRLGEIAPMAIAFRRDRKT